MVIFNRKVKTGVLITVIIVILLAVYLAVNYKAVKQNFVNGFNDGKAERAKESRQ